MKKNTTYHPPESKNNISISFGGALTLSALIFLALPLTQLLSGFSKPPTVVITEPPGIPPPAAIPPDPPPVDETEPEPEPPELEKELKPIDLAAIDRILNPGYGDSLMPGKMPGLDEYTNTIDDMSIFDIGVLDKLPKRIVAIAPVYPFQFKREGIEGWVKMVLIIDQRGNVIKASIRESSHREFEKPSIEAVLQWKFEPGTRNGKAVKVRRIQPFSFKLN